MQTLLLGWLDLTAGTRLAVPSGLDPLTEGRLAALGRFRSRSRLTEASSKTHLGRTDAMMVPGADAALAFPKEAGAFRILHSPVQADYPSPPGRHYPKHGHSHLLPASLRTDAGFDEDNCDFIK